MNIFRQSLLETKSLLRQRERDEIEQARQREQVANAHREAELAAERELAERLESAERARYQADALRSRISVLIGGVDLASAGDICGLENLQINASDQELDDLSRIEQALKQPLGEGGYAISSN